MLDVNNLTKKPLPSIPFQLLSNKILGQQYDLSLAFIGKRRSQTLNRRYRHKDYPTNVLAFPLSNKQGEIFIDLDTAIKTSRQFTQAIDFHIAYLLIHAMLHLKGYNHGSTMEDEEDRLIKVFKLNQLLSSTNEPSYRNRSGYRHGFDSRRRLRVQKRK